MAKIGAYRIFLYIGLAHPGHPIHIEGGPPFKLSIFAFLSIIFPCFFHKEGGPGFYVVQFYVFSTLAHPGHPFQDFRVRTKFHKKYQYQKKGGPGGPTARKCRLYLGLSLAHPARLRVGQGWARWAKRGNALPIYKRKIAQISGIAVTRKNRG